MNKIISGFLLWAFGTGVAVVGWFQPKTSSTQWAVILASIMATGIVLALVGILRVIAGAFPVSKYDDSKREQGQAAAPDETVWPPAPKQP